LLINFFNRAMNIMLNFAKFLGLLLILIMAPSCAGLGVDPWDRDLLAQPAMKLDGNAAVAGLDEKMYYSKEASSGGKGFAGGGCGCN